jgi:hypothetical protein
MFTPEASSGSGACEAGPAATTSQMVPLQLSPKKQRPSSAGVAAPRSTKPPMIAEVAAASAAARRGRAIGLYIEVLAHVADPEVAHPAVEAEAVWVSQP